MIPPLELSCVGGVSLDVELGVLPHPGMIRGGVVGHEIHEELEFSLLETLFQADEVRLRTEVFMQGVARDRKGGATDVGLGKTRERRLELIQPIRMA